MCAPFWAAPDGAVPRRSFPYGLKAPSLGRRQRDPASGRPHGRPPQRRHATDPATGGPARPAGRGQDRPPAPQARPRHRRPRLRPRQVPPPAVGAGHQARDRSPSNRPRLLAWAPALGRRAGLRAPAQLPPPGDPLRALPRDPHRAARARLLDPLLAPPQVIVKDLLNPCSGGEADGGTRTPDPIITSDVLYQLSYVGPGAWCRSVDESTQAREDGSDG